MMDATKARSPEIILVSESTTQSLISDAGTFVTVAGLIGLGVVLDSSAMQWVGAIMAVVVLVGRVLGRAHKRLTVAQARVKLDEIERSAEVEG